MLLKKHSVFFGCVVLAMFSCSFGQAASWAWQKVRGTAKTKAAAPAASSKIINSLFNPSSMSSSLTGSTQIPLQMQGWMQELGSRLLLLLTRSHDGLSSVACSSGQ